MFKIMKKLMKKRWVLIGASVGLLVLVILAASGRLIYFDGPYNGKVIDKETKRPIEGAAVVAVWWQKAPSVAHVVPIFHDAQETLTDQQGNFTIPGIRGAYNNPLARIREPVFTVFKPSYKAYRERRLAPPGEEGRTVVELRLLRTRKGRLENLGAGYLGPLVPKEKYPNLIKLMSVERRNLGFKD